MMHKKKELLEELLNDLPSVGIAYSAGVDSTFLLKVAHDVLGDKAAAFMVRSVVIPSRDIEEAQAFCDAEGIRLIVIDGDPLSIPRFQENPENRCYICKKSLFGNMLYEAAKYGITTLMDGTNADDDMDDRPGMKALSELKIRSPLREAGLTKAEIRQLSEEMNLPTARKASFACLATRIPHGDEITPDKLKRIEAAEDYLSKIGFTQYRVRTHGDLARIEVLPSEFHKILDGEVRKDVSGYLKSLGYKYVALDLTGYGG